LLLGIIMGVAGVALAVLGGVQTAADSNEFNQRAAMATGSFIGIALLIGGAALFIRYSLARYLRFWLVRLVHESHANTDRIVDAIERAAGSGGPSHGAG
jgi:drug/metabolite transporter (DMT)-like permease